MMRTFLCWFFSIIYEDNVGYEIIKPQSEIASREQKKSKESPDHVGRPLCLLLSPVIYFPLKKLQQENRIAQFMEIYSPHFPVFSLRTRCTHRHTARNLLLLSIFFSKQNLNLISKANPTVHEYFYLRPSIVNSLLTPLSIE